MTALFVYDIDLGVDRAVTAGHCRFANRLGIGWVRVAC